MSTTPEPAANRIALWVAGVLGLVCAGLVVAVAYLAYRLPGLVPPPPPAGGSAFPPGVIAVDEKSAEGDIAAVLQAQADAWNKGDLDGFMAGYSRTDLTFTAGGDETHGWQAVRDRYEKRYKGPNADDMGKLAFSDLRVRVLSADAAQVRGAYAVAGGKKPGRGRFTLLMRKEAGGWKVVHDHTSAAEPAKGG